MTSGRPNNFRFLRTPAYLSFAVIFFAWVLPHFVSFRNYGSSALTISWIAGMIMVVGGWYKYHLLTNQVDHSPKSADVVLKECVSTGRPYAVYLRSFDSEQGQRNFDIPGLLLGWDGSLREVEIVLARRFQGRLPVLTLSNPSDPFTMPGVHRFRRLGMPWLIFLEALLPGASLVIVNVTDSPGLMTEMNLVRDLKIFEKTLVIGGTKTSHPEFRWVVSGLNMDDLDNTLADVLDSLRARGEKIPQLPAAHELERRKRLGTVQRLAQAFAFLLIICVAFLAFGRPKLASAEYRSREQFVRELLDDFRR